MLLLCYRRFKINIIVIKMLIRYLKYVMYCSIFSVLSLILLNYYDSKVMNARNSLLYNKKQSHLMYILIWTGLDRDPMRFGEGQITFINRSCPVTSCYITEDRNFFENITDFDVIIFHGSQISPASLPAYRLPYQKYVFASMESAAIYPNCYGVFNEFFNLTLSYKLNSDLYFGYIVIKNNEGDIIGPSKSMNWMDTELMDPINEEVKDRISKKRIAAAWFVSHCEDKSRRTILAQQLIVQLKKYNLTVDVYGECGVKQCPKENMPDCLRMLERDYFFYFSFENSLSEDYVTEKLLHPLQHYTVPIVYGGANYTRFMPDGAYLNAQITPVKVLAQQMATIINNKEMYYNFFRWRNHYSYHYQNASPETDAFCNLCAAINDEGFFNEISVHDYFTNWWNPSYQCYI